MSKSKRAILTNIELQELLKPVFKNLPKRGQLFLPGADFYNSRHSKQQAQKMLNALCKWSGVKPGYFEIVFQNTKESNESSHKIRLTQKIIRDEAVLGRTLAVAIATYLVRDRHKLASHTETVAAATIELGFGLVVINGWKPRYSVLGFMRRKTNVFSVPMSSLNYKSLFHEYCGRFNIPPVIYRPYVMPWARQGMVAKGVFKPSTPVNAYRHLILVNNLKIVAACWILVVLGGIFIFTKAQTPPPPPQYLQDAEAKVSLLNQLVIMCKQKLSHEQRYAEVYSLDVEKKLEAIKTRCHSLSRQQDIADSNYRTLKRQI